MLSCPLPLLPPPPLINQSGRCDVGEGEEQRKKIASARTHTDGEGRRAGAQQRESREFFNGAWEAKVEVRGVQEAAETRPSHSPRSHACGKWHACSAERYKGKHASIVTPAAAVVMVTIITFPVDPTAEASDAFLFSTLNTPPAHGRFSRKLEREFPAAFLSSIFLEVPFN